MNLLLPSSPAVRRIVADYLSRWSWVFALGLLYHFIFLYTNIALTGKASVMISIHAFFGGAALVLRDRAAGTLRLAAALPLTEQERVSTTRWTAIIAPCALWLAAGVVAEGFVALTGASAMSGRECLKATCFLVLATPAAFLTQTIPPAVKPGAEGLQWRLAPWRAGLSAVMLILTMFGYTLVKTGSVAAPAIWIVLGASALGGWGRVRNWVTSQPYGVDASLNTATPVPRFGGRHPLRIWLRDTAVLGGAIGLGLGLFYFVLGFLHPLFWKHSLTAQQITFGLLFAGIASTIRLASSLRPLRAAPVTSARLAAFCVATPMVAALSAVAGGLLAQALTGRMHSVGLANLASWLSCVFFLPLTGCAMLRFSGTTGGYFLSIFLCVFPGMFLAQEEVPAAAYIQVLAMAPLSLLAWWWNHRLITRSSAIYQAMRFLPKPA